MMKLIKRIFAVFMILITIPVCCLFYAFKIEPYSVKADQYELNEEAADKNGVNIVQVSDLHIKDDFTCRDLAKVVEEINRQDPDIVLFTGDLYDNYAEYNDDENIIAELQKIEAGYDKIAVWGNRDYGGGAVRQYAEVMEQSGFTLLKNENRCITLENGKKILFTGLDDSLLGNPYMPEPPSIYDADYDVLLTHEPDTAKAYMDYGYDIILCGHSHGGQVNIPFLPKINKAAVATTDLATEYSGGMYDLNTLDGSKLYVNTGIGTTHISARFGVTPVIAVFSV